MGHENEGSYGLGALLFGAAIGAGLALLLAPKPGRELREDLRRMARDTTDDLRLRGENLGGRVSDVWNEIALRAEELSHSGKDMVDERRRALMAAIEAGRRAYEEERMRYRSERPMASAAEASTSMGS